MTHHNWFLLAKNWSEVSHFLTEQTICESSERDQIANYWCEVIICIDNNVYCHVLMSFKALCKYWQNACWNGISNLYLQQEWEYLKQCGHLLALTKNMVIKHFIATGKFGWRISINHYEMLCLIRTTTQGKKIDKHLNNISTTLSVQVMAPNSTSHTTASAKMIKKYWKLIFLKIYSKRKILVFLKS